MIRTLSIQRVNGLILKEFILIMRDRGIIAMLVILPIMLLILFGYAINLDPKNLPTAIINFDPSPLTRAIISNLYTSKYFNIVDTSNDIGKLSFAMTIPAEFTRKYIRGEHPQFLVEIDGSDPGSSAGALGNVEPILNLSLEQFNQKGLDISGPHQSKRALDFVVHRLYNETNKSSFNIVPGLVGVLLTLTMVVLARYKTGFQDRRTVINALLNVDKARKNLTLAKMEQLNSTVEVYHALAGGLGRQNQTSS
jgi:ABC-2 type transport system permease protein